MCENVSVWKNITEGFEHFLAAAHSDEPVMDQRHSHDAILLAGFADRSVESVAVRYESHNSVNGLRCIDFGLGEMVLTPELVERVDIGWFERRRSAPYESPDARYGSI